MDEGPDLVHRTAVALAVLAAVFALWGGRSWYAAAHDDAAAYSRVRTEALRAGEQSVQNLNTLDYRTLEPDLRTWRESTTGELHEEITRGRAEFEKRVREARTVTSAKVLEAAVAELDARSGRARVLVAVEITVTPPEGDPVVKQDRLVARLDRTGGGWKLSGLGRALRDAL
ncbi:hypothetical protein [Actinomadura sp. WMMB 499]|uniref:hypothetical protein n=1 Tax=Actinomadura sp. WMMB 499 TaxID=1219491 RepID=UPI00124703F0|nr:hypothetical protein [Actinomadura sp. WMMB 499]QFG23673.1 hypothetical protein F7P10_23670 [Actinomadura sp. WMMB 499]